ncbi:MAG: hypothetical protein VB062_05485 [Christensenella sp.]|nr:hypothetical protein [Christensenella sp.]
MNDTILSSITPDNAAVFAEALTAADIAPLVERLASQEDKIRYPAFLLLRARSAIANDLSPYWDLLAEKLTSANSYQRSIGAMLLAANARWGDTERIRAVLPAYFALLNDEKPITVRQSVQALPQVLSAHPLLADDISKALMRIDLMQVKETMRKLILADVIEALLAAREISPNASIEEYLFSALNGGILDEKTKKQLQKRI